MIASLRGKLLENNGESVVIEVGDEGGGVGYQVIVSGATLGVLPPIGVQVHLQVHSHYVNDEPIRLYGFDAADERLLFQTLIGVQGVGPRVALAILAAIPPAELVRAISSGDVARLTQVKGVGRKIAERLALELRDKITALPSARALSTPSPAQGRVPSGPLGDVYGALMQLEFKPAEFESLLETMDPKRPLADLVREALAALRKR